jgi:hypothetical protein
VRKLLALLLLAMPVVLVPRLANAQTETQAACGPTCGEERWPVKTLTDSDASKVNFTPVPTTVAGLVAVPSPDGNSETSRLNTTEETTFEVRGRLVGYKHETDGDYHIVIADLQDPSVTMVVEIPDPACGGVCASPKLEEIKQARQQFVQPFPSSQPQPEFAVVQGNVEVDVTGVGFFDFAHGQTGLAQNCIELHPVLHISFAQPGPFTAKSNPSAEPAKHPEAWFHCIPRSMKARPATTPSPQGGQP